VLFGSLRARLLGEGGDSSEGRSQGQALGDVLHVFWGKESSEKGKYELSLEEKKGSLWLGEPVAKKTKQAAFEKISWFQQQRGQLFYSNYIRSIKVQRY